METVVRIIKDLVVIIVTEVAKVIIKEDKDDDAKRKQ